MEERKDEERTPAGAEQTPDVRRSARQWLDATLGVLNRAGRSVAGRRAGIALSVLTVALIGVVIGVLLGANTKANIGPFNAEMTIRPSLSGGTDVVIPPLGSLLLDSHDGPVHLSVQLGTLDQLRTRALIDDPAGIARASETAVQDVTRGIIRLGVRTLAVSVLCALLLAALVFRNVRRVAWSGLLALIITGGSLGIAGLTLRTQSIEEPRYEGLLVNAPAVVGDARRIANDYNMYSEQLQQLVGNVSRIYTTVSTLPLYDPAPGTKRVLQVSDLHLNPTAWQMIRTVVEQFNIDAVIDTGDITDWGSEPEGSFVSAIGALKVPYIFIRGNHDSARTAATVAGQRNAIVLDNSMTTVAGLTIAGIGDPRFTPDKETSPAGSGLSKSAAEQVMGTGERLANTIRASGQPVDIALVHDPESAGALSGVCPLVLAGHVHKREVRTLKQVPGAPPTRLLVEGSTGGAGLRGLEGEAPTPLSMSVLYFSKERTLQAYDDIQVGGTGQSQVTLERHVINDKNPVSPSGTPTPSPTRS
ncbi:metallophosphoesterase [Micromonospora sp. NPDC049679]|uniref:metallophosphoesterase n=1 Tax=Micromonospora sp. NPDC049679 TaxID=3155920 RepID=UPI0033D6705F